MKISLPKAKEEFRKLRSSVERLIERTPLKDIDQVFADKFVEIYTHATEGDIVAQDYLGYIFKRGRHGLVPENIDLSMKWLILAVSSGNPMSVQRLTIFLNYAFDEIVYHPNFELIAQRNGLTDDNYTFVLGKLVCQEIIKALKIDALNIITSVPTELPFNARTMNSYDVLRNNAIKIVIDNLLGKTKPDKSETQQKAKAQTKASKPKRRLGKRTSLKSKTNPLEDK